MAMSALAVVKEFVYRFQSQDMEGVLELLTDDIAIHESDSVPYPGDYIGKERFIEFANTFPKVWKVERIGRPDNHPDHRYIDGGQDQVVILARVPVTARATGERLELRAAEIFTVRDEKISDVETYYWDTKLIYDATIGAQSSEAQSS